MKIHLRDMFWLVVVAALALGWALDRSAICAQRNAWFKNADKLATRLERGTDLRVRFDGHKMTVTAPGREFEEQNQNPNWMADPKKRAEWAKIMAPR